MKKEAPTMGRDHARYYLENRYQDSGWEPLDGETFSDMHEAIHRAESLSRNAIAYGMVRVVDSEWGRSVVTFPAGGGRPDVARSDADGTTLERDAFPAIETESITCPSPTKPESPRLPTPAETLFAQLVSSAAGTAIAAWVAYLAFHAAYPDDVNPTVPDVVECWLIVVGLLFLAAAVMGGFSWLDWALGGDGKKPNAGDPFDDEADWR